MSMRIAAPGPAAPDARARRQRGAARVVIAAVAILLGVAQAVVWSRIAPGQQVLVYGDGSHVSLPTADYHPFDGLAVAAFSGAAVGLIVAVGVWRVRAIRGAATLTTLAIGTAAGSAICYGLGTLLAGGVDPASVGATGSASIVVAGATMGTPLVMVIEPLIAIATYTFLAAWDGRTDLGSARATPGAVPAPVGSPAVPENSPPAAADGRAPTPDSGSPDTP